MESIIKVWEGERESPQLTPVPPDIEQTYQTEREKLNEQLASPAGSIERRMAEKALQRLEFYYQDIFFLRKEKLMSASLQGTEVIAAALLPWEQQYYGELQRLEFYYKQKIIAQHLIQPPERPLASSSGTPIARTPKPASLTSIQESQDSAEVVPSVEIPLSAPKEEDIIAFVPVRFLRAEGAIIGVDLREYGPFEEGEIANLPEIHARIFIANGVAKQIFPSA